MLFFEPNFIALFLCFLLIYRRIAPSRRPLLIVIASYVFYGCWDWRFLSLLWISTTIDFGCALAIERDRTRGRSDGRRWLYVSLAANFGMLGVFKYFDFFSASLSAAFGVAEENRLLLNVILPAGISFYTFQTVSYVIDVYRRDTPAERNFIHFAAFVAFFPQLIAGPIERAGRLLTQIKAFPTGGRGDLVAGSELFVIGLFKKVVVADNLAVFVDPVFADPSRHDPLTLMLAAYCFSFQIYCDFSGYTDMARGLARMIGIELSANFNLPYFSTGIRDFWQRWHITLYAWFVEYVYKPLGGGRGSALATYRNVMIVFLISGLWHGAGWTFIVWGGLHGALICVERGLAPTPVGAFFGRLPVVARIVLTFHAVTLAWILFRAPDFATAAQYFRGLADWGTLDAARWVERIVLPGGEYWLPAIAGSTPAAVYLAGLALFAGPLVVAEWLRRRGPRGSAVAAMPRDVRAMVAVSMLICVFWLGAKHTQTFVYFQF